jgi:hypothetical protein
MFGSDRPLPRARLLLHLDADWRPGRSRGLAAGERHQREREGRRPCRCNALPPIHGRRFLADAFASTARPEWLTNR